jgi:hypothetical protein
LPEYDQKGSKHIAYYYILIKKKAVPTKEVIVFIVYICKTGVSFMLNRPNKHNIKQKKVEKNRAIT